jgi:hypothetical protein
MSDEIDFEEGGKVYRITPKGIIAVFLMENFGLSLQGTEALDEVTSLAQKLEDMIFKAGYLIFHEEQIAFSDE